MDITVMGIPRLFVGILAQRAAYSTLRDIHTAVGGCQKLFQISKNV
ncbi:MAG: hypothetical protein HC862_09585 [Scytonema sp. RU_4_4]|nr:hypothetical protein [Scytonema sp. RU_4_4]